MPSDVFPPSEAPRTAETPRNPNVGGTAHTSAGARANTIGVDHEPDWTDQVTDLIVDVVDRVHDSTTGPLVRAAKGAVYVVLASIIGVAVLILLTILATRLLGIIPGEIWIPYTALGLILCLLGAWLWSRRTSVGE